MTGPGEELKKMLAGWPFRVATTAECPCADYAKKMDSWGPDECERRLEEIVEHLRGQAAQRGLPFVEAGARLLVQRAITLSRKSAIANL